MWVLAEYILEISQLLSAKMSVFNCPEYVMAA